MISGRVIVVRRFYVVEGRGFLFEMAILETNPKNAHDRVVIRTIVVELLLSFCCR
jgi:hypothetical protein